TWTQQHPAISPPIRDYMAMAYYPALGGVVLTGGLSNGIPLGDTWLWAGNTWTQLHPPTSPPARYGASMVYDPGTQQLVEFGGLTTGNPASNDVWTFNGVTWTKVNTTGGPSPRSAQHVVFDTNLGGELLFGGGLTSSSAFYNDTWERINGSWTQLSPASSPTPRANAVTFYDPARCQMVVFGGSTSGSTDVNDTWTYGDCGTTGYPSDDCASPSAQTIADGWAGDVYGHIRIFQPDPSTLWVCVRVDGEGLDTGGKLIVTYPTAALPGNPGTGTDPQACTNESGNTIPTSHPIESGSVGGGSLPVVTFLVDAFSNSKETWVCVEAGPVQDVLILDGASVTPPGVQYIPDPPGGHAPPEPAPTSSVSGSCASQPGATRLVDMTTAGPSRLYAFASRPAAGGIALCVRADVPSPAPSIGGVLTLNPAGVLAATPTASSYTPTGTPGSDPNCAQPVASLSNPQFAVFVSSPGGTQQPTVCVYSSLGSAVGATLAQPTQAPPTTLSWTPDPGTPIPAFSH
ncbi:MAG: large repetitive protein, partial [Frankiaceae bacterium]|nr:large repetitive protein [Frankiaceae bacterium]